MDSPVDFMPSTRACLDHFLAAEEESEASPTLPTTIPPVLLPARKLLSATLSHLVRASTVAGKGERLASAQLLLALTAEQAALTRRLVEEACAGQWWRSAVRARAAATSASVAPPAKPPPSSHLNNAVTTSPGTPGSSSDGLAAVGLPTARTPVRVTAVASCTPLSESASGQRPAAAAPPPVTALEEVSHVEQRAHRRAVVCTVTNFLSRLTRELSVHQLCHHKIGFAKFSDCTSSDGGDEEHFTRVAPRFLTTGALLRTCRRVGTPGQAEHREGDAGGRAGGGVQVAPTGCLALDRVLAPSPTKAPSRGGFRFGWVTEISGEAGSGKTQLVLQCLLQHIAADIAASVVATPPSRAYLYIVSEDVPAARLGALASGTVWRVLADASPTLAVTAEGITGGCNLGTGPLRDTLIRRLTPEALLSRLQVKLIRDLADLDALLVADGVLERVASAHGAGGCLVAIDSIAAAVAGSERGSAEGGALRGGRWLEGPSIATIGLLLKAFAVRHQACVLVTNQVRSVPVAAHSAVAPLKRRREADENVQSLVLRRHQLDQDAPTTTTVTAPPQQGQPAAEVRRGMRPPMGRGRGCVESLPALGAAWSTSAWHMRVTLDKLASQQVNYMAAGTLSSASRRECLVHGGPDLPPARCGFKITDNGLEDDDA